MNQDDREILDRSYRNRFAAFHELMRNRIRDVLMVSSLYDSFILGEEGGLYELLVNEYMGLNLSHPPEITRVSSGRKALERIVQGTPIDLILTTLHLEDMHAVEFARRVRAAGIRKPLVLLTYDNRELNDLINRHGVASFDKVYLWQGNFRILLAIIKAIEDKLNVQHDTHLVGVQSIILIEDSVKFYSSYLPIIYTELMRHSHRVIEEGVNLPHKMLRMRARPKILLCETYEEAWQYFQTYHETVLGVISDVRFPHGGEIDPQAGIEFAKNVKKSHPDIPILLQSNKTEMEAVAHAVGASFLLKDSPRLLHQLRQFMKKYFSFGDFVFCMPDGAEVDRARNLHELEEKLHTVPDDSLIFHAQRNHFSNWLKARTEFYLAHQLRPQKVSDFSSVTEIRKSLISHLHEYSRSQYRGTITDFDPETFDPEISFTRLGGGSLGGKGRGLAFVDTLLNMSRIRDEFRDISIAVPPTIILETDVFDSFVERNDLGDFALESSDDTKILNQFLKAPMPDHIVAWLRELLNTVTYPLAVRSSSLFEDSQYQPFAGVYETCMLPNNHRDLDIRLQELLSAIRRVYASTFYNRAKGYFKATPYLLEEEKMAVVIQKLVGSRHEDRFYPDLSGVARSHNFYPVGPMKADDGIVSVALGLGVIVVEGGLTIRFCPKYPRHQVQFSSVEDVINYSQRNFYALNMPSPEADYSPLAEPRLIQPGLHLAEKDGVLGPIGSTYSADNDAIYDGISRKGLRLISFASILKYDYFPLAAVLDRLLDLARWGMSAPIEIEFSVNLSVPKGRPPEFRVLQLRPMVVSHEREQLDLTTVPDDRLICRSGQVLGNGLISDVRDIVTVNLDTFERSRLVEVAREVAKFNLELTDENRPYLLIGIGRWGSADPWLGIPVTWDEISGARAIVETGFREIKVTPSQGTHFFQNLNAFQVGYFTINANNDDEFLDWDWLAALPAYKQRTLTRRLKFDSPIEIRMNGHNSSGIIIKPKSK
jgi:CheY-like chemotaxis protein